MQTSHSKRVVTFGEIMMRLSTPGFARFHQAQSFDLVYGGSEANVAMSLAGFGIPAEHVTRFPENEFGRSATNYLRKHGVITDHICYGKERMGLYFLENGAIHRAPKIIYDRFDSAFSRTTPGTIDWDSIFSDAQWFHWTGITPAISQGAADVCREALYAARKRNVTVSADINYRRNLWNYGKTAREIMPELISLSQYIVGGTADIENCLGITSTTFEDACQKTHEQFPSIVQITTTVRNSMSASHNKLAAVLWAENRLYTSRGYDLFPIVDRVGGGDAYMAGLIYGWVTGKSIEETLEFATAASAWKHSIEGDVNIASCFEIEELVKGENTGRLLR